MAASRLLDLLWLVSPVLLALGLAWLAWHAVRGLCGAWWRTWQRNRQRSLDEYPDHVLEAAWRYSSQARAQALARGTASRREIEDAIALGTEIVRQELRRRRAVAAGETRPR